MPYLHLDDADLYYEEHGVGRPFLFNAATSTWGEVWKFYQVDEFKRDHRVIVFDQRGVGRSPGGGSDFSTHRLAADAAALLRHCNAPDAVVLGHSNGGRVSQLLALDHPELVGRLVLASSGGSGNPAGAQGIPLPIVIGLAEKGYAGFIRESATRLGFSEAWRAANPEELERFMKVRLGELPPLAVFLGHVLGRQNAFFGERLKDLKAPTLVMVGGDEDHGAQGGMTHLAAAKHLAAAIPNARLSVLEGQGHYYYFSAPHEMHKTIRDFLAT